MTRAKWQAALDIYRTAREMASGARRAFVESASADPEVVQQVLELLEAPEDLEAAPIPAPAPDRQAGERIGHYEVTGLLGRGGMGEVYAGRDRGAGPRRGAEVSASGSRSATAGR